MNQIIRADELCPEAEVIVHSDPDRVFIAPYCVGDVIRDGKPLIVHGSYRWLCNVVQANLDMWKTTTKQALGFEPEQEVMRRMPIPHIREVYARTREIIDEQHGDTDRYMQSCRNEWVQTFCEFNTLGAVAWRDFYLRYHWLDQEKGEYPVDKVRNFWSHREPQPEEIEAFLK
jgi:hypothetical protein